MYGPMLAPEYGVRVADYRIIGTVVAEDTSEPLKDIKVTYRRYMYTDSEGVIHYFTQEFPTDENGKVDEHFDDILYEGIEPEIILEDVDGVEGGGWFKPDTLRGTDIKKVDDFTLSFDAKLERHQN